MTPFDEDTQTVATGRSSDLAGSATGTEEDGSGDDSGGGGDSGGGDDSGGGGGGESQSDPGGDSDVQPDPARHGR